MYIACTTQCHSVTLILRTNTEIEKCAQLAPYSLEIESGHGPVNDAISWSCKIPTLLVFCILQYIVSILSFTSAHDYNA